MLLMLTLSACSGSGAIPVASESADCQDFGAGVLTRRPEEPASRYYLLPAGTPCADIGAAIGELRAEDVRVIGVVGQHVVLRVMSYAARVEVYDTVSGEQVLRWEEIRSMDNTRGMQVAVVGNTVTATAAALASCEGLEGIEGCMRAAASTSGVDVSGVEPGCVGAVYEGIIASGSADYGLAMDLVWAPGGQVRASAVYCYLPQ